MSCDIVGETVSLLVTASQVIKLGRAWLLAKKAAPVQATEGVRLVEIVIYTVLCL